MVSQADEDGAGGVDTPRVDLRAPDPRLAGVVEVYYFTTASAPFEDRLYPEWGNLRVPVDGEWRLQGRDGFALLPPGGALCGPTDRWTRVGGSHGRGAGILLTALGWARLIGTAASLVANSFLPLAGLLGDVQAQLRAHDPARWVDEGAALFDALLLARLNAMPPCDDAAIRAEAALRARPADTLVFAESVGVSADVLRHVCRRAFGFGPKRLLRRQRLMDTLAQMRAAGLSRRLSSLHEGYADQAHFNREFRHFMDSTPRTYLHASRPLMREVQRQWPEQVFPITARRPDAAAP